jgi:hypothetical protein
MHTDGPAALAAANAITQVTGGDRRTLDAIFRHPLSHGLSWREVVALIKAIGSAEEHHNGEFMLNVGEERLPMRRPHNKDLTAPEVMELRHFLTRAGWSPDGLAANGDAPLEMPRLIIIIDHAGARVFRIDLADEGQHGISAHDPKHLLHHLERRAHDADRDETYPDDDDFFASVASALETGGEIVIIGHGKGQSNEADHLSAYLKAHHQDVYARIVRTLRADLPHLSLPELLEMGRRAFAQDAVLGSG